ncbi:MAG TPA: DUF1552 domain-containing protein [Polyangia bacterium]|jgi:hypothetical protein
MSRSSDLRAARSVRFSRRSLLRGIGAGSALLSPFASLRSGLAQDAAAGGNLLIFFTPNGHKRSLAGSTGNRVCFDASLTAGAMTLGESLQPLLPYQSDVAVIKGLNNKTPTFITSHQDICRILTCQGQPGGETDAGQFIGYGPSIDQSIGIAINQRPIVVAVDPYRDQPHWRTYLSWRASGVNEPFVKNYQSVFADLFGNLTGASTMPDQAAALARTRARNQSLLDFIKNDVSTFRPRVSSADRSQLDAYLDSLRSVEQKVTQLGSATTCATDGVQTEISGLPAKAPLQNDDKSPDGVVDQMQKRGEVWMDLIATAFACASRRVAVIQWQGASEGYDVGANTGSPNHHSVSHYGFGASSGDRWVAIDTWYASRMAYQINALKKLGVLDKTVIVWVSEITEGHNQLNMVTVVAGGKALGMKLGQYIVYPFTGQEVEGAGAIAQGQNPANRGLNDLWITVQQALGVKQATFGDPKYSTGPLAELRG